MKKTILSFTILGAIVIASSAFVSNKKSSSGIAGYTGSPGEGTCSSFNGGCHSGGNSAASGMTLSASPAFIGNEYVPGTTYTVSLTVAASGFIRYGFGLEVLNTSNVNTGTLQAASVGTKFINANNGRKNAVHNGTQLGSGGSFTFVFEWAAPAVGSGNATFYYVGNAVNGSGSSGDFVLSPGSLTLTESSSGVGIKENKDDKIDISVFPNPASGFATIHYASNKPAKIGIYDVHGKLVKDLFSGEDVSGNNSRNIDLTGLSKGVYFLRLSADNKQAQKLLIVQ